jgi:4'-phosphopantetheinyl transferase
MDVHWFEQTDADVPADNDWLSEGEAARLLDIRFPKRRAEWRLGRWTAKHAVAAYLNQLHSLAQMEVRPAPCGAPEVFLAEKPAPVVISLSHRDGLAVCAVAPSGIALGCDLETIEPRSDAFVADYFTAEEQAMVARASVTDRSRIVALLWSAKESALKALRAGLRLDTRCVTATPVDALEPAADDLNGWRPLRVRCTGDQVFPGWWRCTGNFVRTLVTAPASLPPILIR